MSATFVNDKMNESVSAIGGAIESTPKKMWTAFIGIASSIREFQKTLYSLGFLIILAMVGYVVWDLVSRAHPRMFWFSKAQDTNHIDEVIRESTAFALTNYYMGFDMDFSRYKDESAFLKAPQSGAYPLKDTVSAVSKYINFHEDDTYTTLSGIVMSLVDQAGLKLNNDAKDREVVNKALLRGFEENDSVLIDFLIDSEHNALFKKHLDKMNQTSLMNFIDFGTYEDGHPEKDKTVKNYGKYVQVGTDSQSYTLDKLFDMSRIDPAMKSLLEFNSGGLSDIMKKLSSNTNNTCSSTIFEDLSANECFLNPAMKIAPQCTYPGSTLPNNGLIGVIVELRKELLTNIKDTTCAYTPGFQSNKGSGSALYDNTRKKPEFTPIYEALAELENDFAALNTKLVVSNGKNLLTEEDLHLMQNDVYFKYQSLVATKFDSGNGLYPVFDDDRVNYYMNVYGDIISLLQYKFFSKTINYSIFTLLYWYYGRPSELHKNVQNLSNFYACFSELYLFKQYYEDMKDMHAWRNVNKDNIEHVYKEQLVKPNWDLYIMQNIIQGVIVDYFDFSEAYRKTRWYWDMIYITCTNPGTFLGGEFDNGSRVPRQPTDKPTQYRVQTAPPKPKKTYPPSTLRRTHETFANEDDEDMSEARSEDAPEGGAKKETKEYLVPDPTVGIAGMFGNILKGLEMGTQAIVATASVGLVSFLMVSFLPAFFKILQQIIKYINNPLEFFSLLARFILFMIVYSLMIVLNIGFGGNTLGHIILMLLYKLGMIPVSLFKIAINGFMFGAITLFGFVFAVLDGLYFDGILTRWFYRNFMACENSPFSWYETPAYQKGNKYERTFGVCSATCSEGYEPGMGGMMCMKTPGYVPKQCPQALIMRISKGSTVSSPYILTKNIPYTDWGNMTASKKAKLVGEIIKQKQDYFTDCQTSMKQYDDIAKNICRNADTSAQDKDSKAALHLVCKTAYCSNGRMEPFCYKYGEERVSKIKTFSNKNIFIQGLMYTTVVTSFLTGLYLLNKNKVLRIGG